MYNIPINSHAIVFHSQKSFDLWVSGPDRRDLLIKSEKIPIKTSRQLNFFTEEYTKHSYAWDEIQIIISQMNMWEHLHYSYGTFKVFKRTDKDGDWLLVVPGNSVK